MSNIPLTNIIERIERSIFHAIRKELVDKGYLPDITTFPNTILGTSDYYNAIKTCAQIKGFAIEVFNNSSGQSKNLKKIPRIVIVPNQVLPGALGGSPDLIYTQDPLNADAYVSNVLPPQTANFTIDIHLVSSQARQSRVMAELLGISVPRRGYVPLYDDLTNSFFVNHFSYRTVPDPSQGINDDIYMYEVQDIFETASPQIGSNIKKIKEIKIEMNEGTIDNPMPLKDITIT